MNLVRTLRVVVASGFVASASLTAIGCGGGGDAKHAKIAPGEMPEGEQWRGVYFHPVYGYLHVEEEGNNIVGRWKRTDHTYWGEMSGVAKGNVVHYQWKEHRIGMVGASATTKGKGYFVYTKNADGIAEIKGEFGMNDSELGSAWNNVKQARMEPDLKSIGGDAEGVTPSQL